MVFRWWSASVKWMEIYLSYWLRRGSPKDVTSGYKLGADNYVKKPFVAEELDAHIHALLKLRKGQLRAMKQIATTSGNTHWMPHTQPLGMTKTVRKQC